MLKTVFLLLGILCAGIYLNDRFSIIENIVAFQAAYAQKSEAEREYSRAVSNSTALVGSEKTSFLERACVPKSDGFLEVGEHAPLISNCIQGISIEMQAGCKKALLNHELIRIKYYEEALSGKRPFECL